MAKNNKKTQVRKGRKVPRVPNTLSCVKKQAKCLVCGNPTHGVGDNCRPSLLKKTRGGAIFTPYIKKAKMRKTPAERCIEVGKGILACILKPHIPGDVFQTREAYELFLQNNSNLVWSNDPEINAFIICAERELHESSVACEIEIGNPECSLCQKEINDIKSLAEELSVC